MNTPSSGKQHGFRRPPRILQTPSTFLHKTPFLTSSAGRANDDIDTDEPGDEVNNSPTATKHSAEADPETEAPVNVYSPYTHEGVPIVHDRPATAKRRKVSNYTASFATDAVSISSSGSSIDLRDLDDSDDRKVDEDEMLLAHSPPSSPTSILRTPHTTTSRFRHVPPQSQTSAAAQEMQPRPSFIARLRQPPPERGPHPALAYTLPEAFSPSRRRGKAGAGYRHGGSAETVRQWVLEAAGRAGDEQSEVVLKVESAVKDKGGRFVFVHAPAVDELGYVGDEEGPLWMLVDSDSHLRRGAERKVDLVKAGSQIVLKGGKSMRWSLPLGNDGQTCMFAAVWDVVM